MVVAWCFAWPALWHHVDAFSADVDHDSTAIAACSPFELATAAFTE